MISKDFERFILALSLDFKEHLVALKPTRCFSVSVQQVVPFKGTTR